MGSSGLDPARQAQREQLAARLQVPSLTDERVLPLTEGLAELMQTGPVARQRHRGDRAGREYYGACYSSALHRLLKRINAYLLRWLRKKYKRLHGYKKAKRCWDGIASRDPGMLAHWQWNRAAW